MAEEQNRVKVTAEFKVSHLTLTLNRDEFPLAITGHTQNPDEALAMLEMAKRQVEARMRAEQMQQVMAAPMRAPIPLGRPGRG